jgi:uncharacterized membrane protein YeaQ/YmgE (transglycosylase-associated protein family)
MAALGWMLIGGLVGLLASKMTSRHGRGLVIDVLLGCAGALVAGAIYHAGGTPRAGLNAWTLLIACVGAAFVVVLWRVLTGRRVT